MSTHTSQSTPAPPAACMRNGSRFTIDAPCRFWWSAATVPPPGPAPSPTPGQPHFGAGRVSNLSVAGAAIDSAILPHVGATIMLEIDLPRSAHVGQASTSCLTLAAEGKVLRHHPDGAAFAAHITHATLAQSTPSTPQ